MKKRLSKILWYGDTLDENLQAAPPALSPSDEEHLQGLNYGEIYMCIADADPALFIRTSANRIVYFKALDIEALSKFFIRKDRPDEAGFLIKFLGGLYSDYIQSMNFSSGALGEGFLIKVDSKTGKSYIEVDELYVRMKAMFSELEIKKLSYAGGNYMFTAAGMKCGKVEEHEDFWRCYLLVDDGETAIENPFKEGDQVRFQDFNIKPGVYENVSNRYYWRLCVGIGEDYIDLSKTDCDANSDAPQEGDSLVQLGNRTDKARQNAITLSVYGDDAPSIHQYAGIDSYSLAGKEVTVISIKGNKFMGDFILKTGVNILTQFQILEDLIYSEISAVRDEVQAKDNYLYNAAFASNTNGWETTSNIRFFTVNGIFLLINDEFYSRKDAMAAVVRYGDRNALRIIDSGIKQANADLADKPTYEEGEALRKFFISFRYKVTTAGTLTIGFPGQNLHFTERLEPGEEYALKEYSGTWDGTGDFELKFTGDIYIHSLALTDNAYEDLYTKLSSEIEQTAESIRLEVKELSESNNQKFSQIEQRADSIELSVKEVEKSVTDLGTSTTERFSSINQTVDSISASVTNITSDVAGINKTISEAGWITTEEGNELWASITLENGETIVSKINQTASSVAIEAEHIRLEGIVTANDNFKVNLDGSIEARNGNFSGTIEANGGFIGAFQITDKGLSNISDNPQANILIEKSGGRFFRVNSSPSDAMCSIRGDETTALSVSAYGNRSIGINVIAQAGNGTYAIKATGDVSLEARSGEAVSATRLNTYGLALNVTNKGYSSVSAPTSYTAQETDDIIIYGGPDVSFDPVLFLPSSATKGKIIYLKNQLNRNISVKGNLMNASNRGTSSAHSINQISCFYVFDGSYWIHHFCG